jgi:hypothetical protein
MLVEDLLEEAEEYVEVLRRLWERWEDGAGICELLAEQWDAS